MQILIRTDASIQIGNGHVMRCLTLADALKKEGADCHFICRLHQGNMLKLIQQKGHKTHPLPVENQTQKNGTGYQGWLGVGPENDAEETQGVVKSISVDPVDWIIVDHYALGKTWEQTLRPYCKKIMVIDDLADRQHDCDLLLDQTFGRIAAEYKNLTPGHCVCLTGAQYALLRPEFAELRGYSLARRKNPELKQLLITLGGVDKGNVTGDVLDSLQDSNLPEDCRILVVLGEHSPWIETIEKQALHMPWQTTVRVNVQNMAQLMADSDLCIGAAGSTTWERCCLGLPTIMLPLAENQKKIADELAKKEIVQIACHTKKIPDQIKNVRDRLSYISQKSFNVTDGLGVQYLKEKMISML